jgi:hypothetical protein
MSSRAACKVSAVKRSIQAGRGMAEHDGAQTATLRDIDHLLL